jgi:hypothetical protein
MQRCHLIGIHSILRLILYQHLLLHLLLHLFLHLYLHLHHIDLGTTMRGRLQDARLLAQSA